MVTGVQTCALPISVIGYESAAGSLMNVRTDSYLGQVADYLSTLTDDPARAVSLARDTMNHSAPAERVTQDATPLSYGLTVYAKFSIYPIMAFAVVTISTLMASLGRRAVRSRQPIHSNNFHQKVPYKYQYRAYSQHIFDNQHFESMVN